MSAIMLHNTLNTQRTNMKFNVGIFADNDLEYRVDGYTIEAESMNAIDFAECVYEATIKFPTFCGILIEKTA